MFWLGCVLFCLGTKHSSHGDARVARYISPCELESIAPNRTTAHMQVMLAQELALTLGTVDLIEAKVCAVITGLPHSLRETLQESKGSVLAVSSDSLTACLMNEVMR